MRHLLTLVSLLLVGSVWADDFNFNSPRAKAAMEKYQYDKEDLLRDLEAALEHERTKGSLEEAIKIRDAIATLKQQPDAPVANAKIPADAVEWNGHFYWVSIKGTTWHDAKAKCEKMGGHLARIENQAEHDFISHKMVNQHPNIQPHDSLWIDGKYAKAKGDWRFSNQEKVLFFVWNQAGDLRQRGGPPPSRLIEGEDILKLVAGRNSMWPASSSNQFPYICEWDGPAGSTQRAKKIPADAVKYKGNYCKVYDEIMPHSMAQKRCEMMGGHLVRVETSAKQAFIETLASRGKNRGYWIDGTDEETEGTWRFDDGTPMHYFNWGSGPPQPNNDNGMSHYLVMYRPDKWRWHDNSSGERLWGFICEWEGGGSAPETPTKPERTKPKPEEPIKKLSPKHAKRVLDDANLWEGKPGVWFLKRAKSWVSWRVSI